MELSYSDKRKRFEKATNSFMQPDNSMNQPSQNMHQQPRRINGESPFSGKNKSFSMTRKSKAASSLCASNHVAKEISSSNGFQAAAAAAVAAQQANSAPGSNQNVVRRITQYNHKLNQLDNHREMAKLGAHQMVGTPKKQQQTPRMRQQ